MVRKLRHREESLAQATLHSICSQSWASDSPTSCQTPSRQRTASWSPHSTHLPPTPPIKPGSLGPSACGLNAPNQDSFPQTPTCWCAQPQAPTLQCTHTTASNRHLSPPAMPQPPLRLMGLSTPQSESPQAASHSIARENLLCAAGTVNSFKQPWPVLLDS